MRARRRSSAPDSGRTPSAGRASSRRPASPRSESGGDVGLELANYLAAADRHAFGWELLPETAAVIEYAVDEDAQPAHGAGGQVMQYEARPRVRQALRERRLGPAARIFPVARDSVPQHAGHALFLQQLDRDRIQEVRVEGAASAKGPEEAVGVRALAERDIGVDDLGEQPRRIVEPPERLLVRPGVVADPVAFGVRALGDRAPLGIGELRAEGEEGRVHAGVRKNVEHARRDRGLRTIV